MTEADSAVASAISERELQANVIEMAERLGLLVFHPYDSRRSLPGFPDLVVVGKRSVYFVELKRQNGRLRPEQQAWRDRLAAVEEADGSVKHFVWRPNHWLEGTIETWLRLA